MGAHERPPFSELVFCALAIRSHWLFIRVAIVCLGETLAAGVALSSQIGNHKVRFTGHTRLSHGYRQPMASQQTSPTRVSHLTCFELYIPSLQVLISFQSHSLLCSSSYADYSLSGSGPSRSRNWHNSSTCHYHKTKSQRNQGNSGCCTCCKETKKTCEDKSSAKNRREYGSSRSARTSQVSG